MGTERHPKLSDPRRKRTQIERKPAMLGIGKFLLELPTKGVFDWINEKVAAFRDTANGVAVVVAIIAFVFLAGRTKWTMTGIIMGLVAGACVIWLVPGGGLEAVGKLFAVEAK